ncbi:MAG: c-type cytochrome [Prevotella sp.]|nr:c-type cytochrome [Prevotella sp.]
MKDIRKITRIGVVGVLSVLTLSACHDDDNDNNLGTLTPSDEVFGKGNEVFSAEEWYPGGKLGTTEKASYSAAAPAVGKIAGMEEDFNTGEDFFEHLYTFEQQPRKGLGPAWVRNSCIHCHPSYGHGKRQTEYRANTIGNGYLLVIYHPNNNAYISEVTGMPQTQAMTPFEPPIDESQINIQWKEVKEMESGLPMTFPDGERYSLIYPEVNIPQSAFNTNPKPENYEVRLESTIGIYGTGLLDAITDEDMREQYRAEAPYVDLNPAIWDKASNDFAASAYYSAPYNDLGTFRGSHGPVKRFTYAMTRGSLQDGAGANAIWNITNVTRSDRHFLYSTPAWAKAQSENPNVINYIKQHGADGNSILHPYYADGTEAGISARVNEILSTSSIAKKETFDKYLFLGSPYNSREEMTDKQYYQFMVWHRGLAVPAARDLDDSSVKRGKKLFTEMGCAQCHRPSWKTGNDDMWVDAAIKSYADANGLAKDGDYTKLLPKYSNQIIWPYTDMVQHRLFMVNDIRTGWCRTTPLWGRGLSRQLTGADDRLHDCRARTEVEAIMWHGYSKQSDAYNSTVKFFNLSKSDRDAVVKFIRSI